MGERAAMCGEEAHTGHMRPPPSGPGSWQWDEDRSVRESGYDLLPATDNSVMRVGRRVCLLSRGVLIPWGVQRLALHRHVISHIFTGIDLNKEECAAFTTFPSTRGREGMPAVGGRCEGQDGQPLGAAQCAPHQPKPDTAVSSSPSRCARAVLAPESVSF